MSFGDLAAENEANAGTPGLGSEERHKQICRVWQSRTVVDNPQLHLTALSGSRAPVLRRIGRGDSGLRGASVFGVGDAVAVAVDERTVGSLRIGPITRRRQRAGIVAVGYAVTILVGLRATGAVGIGDCP